MIKVTYHRTDGSLETTEHNTLVDWFYATFGKGLNLPDGLRLTHGTVCTYNDITQELTEGDPNGYFHRTDGEYHAVITPGDPVTTTLVVIGVVAASVVAVKLLAPSVPTPPSNQNRRQESPSNSLGNRQNTSRPGERFPDVRGFEPAVYMDLLMEPYRRYENNRQSEYLYGTVTKGKADIVTPREGDTPLGSINEAQFNGYWPNTSPNSGDAPFLSIGGVIGEPVIAAEKSPNVNGQELIPPNEGTTSLVEFRASSNGTVTVRNAPLDMNLTQLYSVGKFIRVTGFRSYLFKEVATLQIGAGDPVEYDAYDQFDADGSFKVLSVSRTSLRLDVTSSPAWQYFGSGFDLRRFVYYIPDTQQFTFDPNPRETYPNDVDTLLTPSSLQDLVTQIAGPFRLRDGSNGGWVNLVARNGLRKSNGTDDYRLTVNLQFRVYELTEDGIRTGNSFAFSTSLSSNPDRITDQVGKTVDFNNPYQYAEIIGVRTSNTDKNFEGTVIDEVLWDELYTSEPINGWSDPGDVTTAHVKIRQNPTATAVQERKINFGVRRYERHYLGNGLMSGTEDTPSDEFADTIVGLALDPYIGKGTTLDQLDIDSLYETQEEIAAYFGTRAAIKFGYTFDTTEMTFEEHLTLVAQAVFCKAYRIGNRYYFRFDRPRAEGERALLLNHRLKYNGSDKRRRNFSDEKQVDGVLVTYKDRETRAFETFAIPLGSEPVNPQDIELNGVIYRDVAEWHGWRVWNKIKYRRVIHETKAHSLARGLVPDDRIQMANDTSTKAQGGQVMEQNGLYLRLAQGTTVETGETYSITLLYFSGTVENILCEAAPDVGRNWVKLFSMPSEDLYTGHLKWRTAYNLYLNVEREKDDMLVESVDVNIRNGREEVDVTAINYDPRYWDNDPTPQSTGSFSDAFDDSFDKGYNRP